MKISLRKGGGFAALPGLEKLLQIDTDTLNSSQADELTRLVNHITTSIRPGTSTWFQTSSARDLYTYCLSIDQDGICTEINFDEMTAKPELQSIRRLIEGLKTG